MNEHTDSELEDSPLLQHAFGEALPKMRMFHVKLSEEGEKRGLIGPRDVDILWERHLLNSAAVVPYIAEAVKSSSEKTVADLGSGGGFPGIVAAACLPECSFALIEPMERRVAWLEECVEELDLQNVEVVRARAEEVIEGGRRNNARQGFDVVTCRAVAPMTKLAGWTLPLVKKGGQLIALKGRSAPQEIEKASRIIKKFGGVKPRVVEAQVGEGLEPTHLVVVQKK